MSFQELITLFQFAFILIGPLASGLAWTICVGLNINLGTPFLKMVVGPKPAPISRILGFCVVLLVSFQLLNALIPEADYAATGDSSQFEEVESEDLIEDLTEETPEQAPEESPEEASSDLQEEIPAEVPEGVSDDVSAELVWNSEWSLLQYQLTFITLQSLLIFVVFSGFLLMTLSGSEQYRLAGFRIDNLQTQVFDAFKWFLLALLPVSILLTVVRVITIILFGLETVNEQLNPVLQWLMRTPLFSYETMLLVVSAVIVAPLLEELLYRVILQNWLQRWLSVRVSIVITAIAFALAHGPADALPLLPIAVLFGIIYHYRRSYLTNVLFHALFNLYNVMVLLIMRSIM